MADNGLCVSYALEIEKLVLDNSYSLHGLWWTRNMVHWGTVRNYVAPPNYSSNQKLPDVWRAEH